MFGFRRSNLQPRSLLERSQLWMLVGSTSYRYFYLVGRSRLPILNRMREANNIPHNRTCQRAANAVFARLGFIKWGRLLLHLWPFAHWTAFGWPLVITGIIDIGHVQIQKPKNLSTHKTQILNTGSLYLDEVGTATLFQHNTDHVIANSRDRYMKSGLCKRAQLATVTMTYVDSSIHNFYVRFVPNDVFNRQLSSENFWVFRFVRCNMLESEDGNRRNCCLCCTTLGNEKRLQEYLCYASAAWDFHNNVEML